ncbi:MAG: hypothetical protein VB086_12550 [Clostridiaceae bacterium]|nr:hypothetical protein [Clostridiaceae bacterium]
MIPSKDPFYQTLNSQLLATSGVILAGVLTFYVLLGQKEKYEGTNPCKDYSYIDTLPRVSILLLLGSSAYFAYLAYLESEYKKKGSYYWTLFANLILLVSVIIKTGVVFTAKPEEEAVAAEE